MCVYVCVVYIQCQCKGTLNWGHSLKSLRNSKLEPRSCSQTEVGSNMALTFTRYRTNTKKDVLLIIGGWNAKVGSQELPGVTGKFWLGIQNEAGQRLTEF